MRFETLVIWGFENRGTFWQTLGGSSTSSTTKQIVAKKPDSNPRLGKEHGAS